MSRVVASYTTLPSRYDVLYESMQTLKRQTRPPDVIYLTLPYRAARLDQEYPPLPEKFNDLCTVVRSELDYGPLTKVYGALMSEKHPDTVIISCDDDVMFSPNHIETMLHHHVVNPNIAICGTGALIGRGLLFISIVSTVQPFRKWSGFTGFDVEKDGRAVDLIFGVAGVLYTRKMFPSPEVLHEELLSYALKDTAIFHNDDILISGYLSREGIERRVFFDIPTIKHVSGDDALSMDFFKMFRRMEVAIDRVKEYGFFTSMESVPLGETPTGRVLITIVVVILIIVLAVLLYQFL